MEQITAQLFNKPGIIGITADINQGKSMLLYHLLELANRSYTFNLFYYGLRLNINLKNSQRVYSVAELEDIRNSIIIVDEFSTLFDLENRKTRHAIENTLRLIYHNNNILILCGVPENYKKFISAKLDMVIYKKCTIADFINGSTIKQRLLSYNGNEKGTELLNLLQNEAILFDGKHYTKFNVPYYESYDTKRNNESILKAKCAEKCANPVPNKKEKIILEIYN